jgi:hypothetical protein
MPSCAQVLSALLASVLPLVAVAQVCLYMHVFLCKYVAMYISCVRVM